MHSKPDKSAGVPGILRHSGLKKPMPIICLLLLTLVSLVGCSYAVPQYANVPQHTYQQPSQETPGVAVQPPEIMRLNVDNMSLSTEGLNLNIQAEVLNPNPFSIDIDNLEVFTRGAAGVDNMLDTIPGGSIESTSVRTFDFGIVLPNNVLLEREQTIGINARTLNADKILPVSATTDISIPEVLNNLIIDPQITAQANITKISWSGLSVQLEAQVEGDINNPNPLSLHYNIIRILVKDKEGGLIAESDIPGDSLAANSDYPFKKSIVLPIGVMNETGVTVDTETTIQITNYIQTFRGSTVLQVPKLTELISVPQIKLDTNAIWVNASPTPIFEMTIQTLIQNDNWFSLTTGDLSVNIYGPDNTLISSDTKPSNGIQGVACFSTKTLTSWVNLSPDDIGRVPIDATITAETYVGVAGVHEEIPLNASMVFTLNPQGSPY
jgi:LEA14-like dessication related protein